MPWIGYFSTRLAPRLGDGKMASSVTPDRRDTESLLTHPEGGPRMGQRRFLSCLLPLRGILPALAQVKELTKIHAAGGDSDAVADCPC